MPAKHLYPTVLSHYINLCLGQEFSVAIKVWKSKSGETKHYFYKVHIK